jgi:hypothetical protein
VVVAAGHRACTLGRSGGADRASSAPGLHISPAVADSVSFSHAIKPGG